MFGASGAARLGDGRVVYLHGTPHEQGRQLGKAAGDLIRENIAAATQLCDQIAAGLNRSAYSAVVHSRAEFGAAPPRARQTLTDIELRHRRLGNGRYATDNCGGAFGVWPNAKQFVKYRQGDRSVKQVTLGGGLGVER